MNSFMKFIEVSSQESQLSKLAKEIPNKKIDVNELDKPLFVDTDNNVGEQNKDSSQDIERESQEEKKGLSEEQKNQIREEKGWSDEIIGHIESWEQYEVYRDADLHEAEVNGRKCLVKNIDLDYIDEKTGLTNRELMEKGRSPIDSKTGEKIELHHMGQSFDSPFAELTENSEHGGKNDCILHDKDVVSWRREPELKNQYQNHDRPNHWKNRISEGE